MDRIVIVGLGLIGGSLGLAMKSAKLRNVEVVGVDISWDAVNAAKRKGAVDSTEKDVAKALLNAAMVVVATPINSIEGVFRTISPYVAEGAVVTDTASTKGEVMRWAAELLPSYVHFVGGHPLAGREVGGLENASATLFKGASYCIVPSQRASKAAVELTVGMATAVGATPYYVEAEEHDILVGGISHLPLVLSAALVSTISRSPSWDEMSKLAASGFQDTSRLASSNLELSQGITKTNKAGIVHWLDAYMSVLKEYRRLLDEAPEQLLEEFERAQVARDKWVLSKEGKAIDSKTEGVPTFGDQVQEMLGGNRVMQLLRREEEERKNARR